MNKELALSELDRLDTIWSKKYPIVIRSWRNNWERLSQYFKYPEDIRRIIYTTNTIEAVHRQFRKLTKTKGAFPNEDSLFKLLYLGIQTWLRIKEMAWFDIDKATIKKLAFGKEGKAKIIGSKYFDEYIIGSKNFDIFKKFYMEHVVKIGRNIQ